MVLLFKSFNKLTLSDFKNKWLYFFVSCLVCFKTKVYKQQKQTLNIKLLLYQDIVYKSQVELNSLKFKNQDF